MFSNMYISPFKAGGYTYNSVEHYFHSMKFWRDYPEFAKTFTLESGSAWSKDPFKSKTAGKAGRVSKAGKLFQTKEFKLPTNVKLRSDFYNGFDKRIMADAFQCKFGQNPNLRQVLLNTKDAKLIHLVTQRGKASELQHWDHLEKVRESFK
jgi:predicted NAD-dependent protein-ADP-ribosyltransferase YbiA (DUF1768 family)